jgi:hypothetical protein
MSDSKDGYGFQPSTIETWKTKLKAIIGQHQQRREVQRQDGRETEQAPAPRVELFTAGAEPEPVAEEPAPISTVETPAPEPEPDFTDSTVWLETREPILQVIEEGNDAGIEVTTGKYRIAYRRRTAEDGDTPFIILPAQPRKLPEPEKIEWSNLQRTPAAFHGTAEGRQWIGGPQRDEGPRVARPDSSGRYHAPRQGVRYSTETGEPI